MKLLQVACLTGALWLTGCATNGTSPVASTDDTSSTSSTSTSTSTLSPK